ETVRKGLWRRLCPAKHGARAHPGYARGVPEPALPLGLRRDADHEAPRWRDLTRPHETLLGATLPVPLRLAALDIRRARHDRDVHGADLDDGDVDFAGACLSADARAVCRCT